MKKVILPLIVLAFLAACSSQKNKEQAARQQYEISNFEANHVNLDSNLTIEDEEIAALIQPYKDSLDAQMNQVLAHSETEMWKGSPESSLGNFCADVTLEMCRKYYTDGEIDFALQNKGGIRLPTIPAGPITKGKIYEMLPFDNFLVVLTLDSSGVVAMLDTMSAKGGWPVAGITLTIDNGKATNILVNEAPLTNRDYKVATNDYLANGGDNMECLKGKPQENLGIFIRDAFIDYLSVLDAEGKKVSARKDGRIRLAGE